MKATAYNRRHGVHLWTGTGSARFIFVVSIKKAMRPYTALPSLWPAKSAFFRFRNTTS